jgi:hypothetical protein
MNYGFHPAAEAEYLEQIAFYEARQRGLGARYRDYFLRTIRKVTWSARARTRLADFHPARCFTWYSSHGHDQSGLTVGFSKRLASPTDQ